MKAKRIFSKATALLLTVMMVCSLFTALPLTAYAAGDMESSYDQIIINNETIVSYRDEPIIVYTGTITCESNTLEYYYDGEDAFVCYNSSDEWDFADVESVSDWTDIVAIAKYYFPGFKVISQSEVGKTDLEENIIVDSWEESYSYMEVIGGVLTAVTEITPHILYAELWEYYSELSGETDPDEPIGGPLCMIYGTSKFYMTLEEAFAHEFGDIVIMLRDLVVDGDLTLEPSSGYGWRLDLSGRDITINGAMKLIGVNGITFTDSIGGATLTIGNGFSSEHFYFDVRDGVTATVSGDVHTPLGLGSSGADVTVYGCVYADENAGGVSVSDYGTASVYGDVYGSLAAGTGTINVTGDVKSPFLGVRADSDAVVNIGGNEPRLVIIGDKTNIVVIQFRLRKLKGKKNGNYPCYKHYQNGVPKKFF